MEPVERHFEIAFSAPDGIKKLRELILTLAMQGKLVPQDDSDPPASQLLKEIEDEKKRLVKEGKIKEPKPVPPVASDGAPYSVPKGWLWVRLRQICHDWGQQTPSSRFTYIDVGAIDNNRGTISSNTPILDSSEAPSRARKIVRKGTVIYSTVRPYLLNAALVDKEFSPEPIVSTAFAILHPYTGVDGRYIYFFLRSPFFVSYVEANQKGVAYPAINDGDLFNGEFPLPPASEQRRIVAKIDELMVRCDELEKLRAERDALRLAVHAAAMRKLLNVEDADRHIQAREFLSQHFGELYTVKENVRELRKAILQLAVLGKLVPQDQRDQSAKLLLDAVKAERLRSTKSEASRYKRLQSSSVLEDVPFAVPTSWVWTPLENLLTYGPTNGTSPQAVEYETAVRSLTLSATSTGKFKGEFLKFVDIEVHPDSDLWLRDGDILVQRGNTLEYVGVSAIYRGSPQTYIYPDLMMKIRVSQSVDVDYVYYAMSSEVSRNFLRARATGTSGTMPKISQGTLRNLPIALPPLAEQKRIVAQIRRMTALCDALEQQIDCLMRTQASLLGTVMAGVEAQRCA